METLEITVDEATAATLGDRLSAAILEGLDRAGRLLVEETRSNLSREGPPVKGDFPRTRSGQLKDSIGYRVADGRLALFSTAPFAADLELGDHPFLARTVKENEARIVQLIFEAIREALT